jgi:hypothetical protein
MSHAIRRLRRRDRASDFEEAFDICHGEET